MVLMDKPNNHYLLQRNLKDQVDHSHLWFTLAPSTTEVNEFSYQGKNSVLPLIISISIYILIFEIKCIIYLNNQLT